MKPGYRDNAADPTEKRLSSVESRVDTLSDQVRTIRRANSTVAFSKIWENITVVLVAVVVLSGFLGFIHYMVSCERKSAEQRVSQVNDLAVIRQSACANHGMDFIDTSNGFITCVGDEGILRIGLGDNETTFVPYSSQSSE